MSGSVKLGLIILAVVLLGGLAIQVVGWVIGGLLSLLVPVLVLGAIALVIYGLVGRKALGGGRRRTLP